MAGTSGTGYNNNTQARLDDYLASSSQPAFPYWQNLVRVHDASGVYLGFNPTTQRGWVLSAAHFGPAASINVGGSAYSVRSVNTIGATDLRLYEIGGGLSDPALPGLATVPLASSFALPGDFSLMFGRAFTNNTSAPYGWVHPGYSDANGMRWGTNTVQGGDYFFNSNRYIVTNFSANADPSVTPFEAQGASGDSGGGLFIYRDGQWQLSGIAHFVDDGPDLLEQLSGPQTGDNVVNPSQFGDFTGYSDVHARITDINAFTGTLIPEPSSLWLAVAGLGLTLRRRRVPDHST